MSIFLFGVSTLSGVIGAVVAINTADDNFPLAVTASVVGTFYQLAIGTIASILANKKLGIENVQLSFGQMNLPYRCNGNQTGDRNE